ncbi:uncharacterized protein E0L32_011712 [Thyridium curvatum]|uniref:Histone acetyltransferase type B catalytic subunit n=1 Tax=Thyridium curvatum TaxID=1093900 RepID=A0A507BLI0_9PEZI|nr:uncharacterized protein E0L32_011712 [Thyridium curvatum]TPX18379.1 hypothetical protein E0L32_011712 [Thyridium curvatum]
MAQADDTWSANANDAFEISLVKPSSSGLKTLAKFNPKFTYPIFGDDESIFGYQGLKINLRYHANDMRPNLDIAYNKKFKAIGETEAADIHQILKDFLPEVAFQRAADFENAIKSVPKDWAPPGTRLKDVEATDGEYSVWYGSLADPAIKQMVQRIQILVPLFIEGGSFIGTDDSDSADRWTVFFMFRKRHVLGADDEFSYEFVGYSTVYRFFLYRPHAASKEAPTLDFELPKGDFSLAELPCRTRISQFVILPPFQGKGNAARLYSTIFTHYLENAQTVEITVEDPNEAFDDLRDLTDLAFLRRDPEFNQIRIDTSVKIPKKGPAPRTIVDPSKLETLRQRTKIAPRQFARVVEMQLLSKLPEAVRPSLEQEPSKEQGTAEQHHEYQLWRLWVKQRIYRQNKEILSQLDRSERIDKLEETLSSVELEYLRLLGMFEHRGRHETSANGKRKLEVRTEGGSSKKARLEAA